VILEMVKNDKRVLVMGGFGDGVDSITLRKFFEVGFRSLTPLEFDKRATYFPGNKLLSCTRNDDILGRGVP
jgi:predicted membrane-bound spermidine synthase